MSQKKRFVLLDNGTERGRFASLKAAKQKSRELDLKVNRAEIQDAHAEKGATCVWRLLALNTWTEAGRNE